MSKLCLAGFPTCRPSKRTGCAVKVTFRAREALAGTGAPQGLTGCF